ncbi:SymE family type I addiction module toxin [Serratia quinivorans]|uniref:SymE family type I addiction module toxin n=1 Tax=Serratia quinivorans TaxID=137545 RepID=UPI0034C62029
MRGVGLHYVGRIIVGYRPNGGQPNPYPQLTLKGRWLEALGFTRGQPVTIIAERGQLIIRTEGAV